MTHLLVTNDFPPKIGGIQSYLWELWKRLDPATYAVLTASSHPDGWAFDVEQATKGIRIERAPGRVLLPTPGLARQIRNAARHAGAELVLIDPAFPLGVLGPRLGLPYGLVLHGAEVAVPARVPGVKQALAHALRKSAVVVSAGAYPARAAARALGRKGMPRVVEIPPGVDVDRFHPLSTDERRAARAGLGLPLEGPLVVSVSRLVPRKGMDVLIDAAAILQPEVPGLTVAIAGRGRDQDRLAGRVAEASAPVRLLGAVPDGDLPALFGAADVFAMLCRDRWLGLEQEGFGIVFLEAAAAGVPQVAGGSGGAWDAVEHERTGLVLRRPAHAASAARAIGRLLADGELRAELGSAARRRVETSFDYDVLAPKLATALAGVGG